jgi:hypothetical protein
MSPMERQRLAHIEERQEWEAEMAKLRKELAAERAISGLRDLTIAGIYLAVVKAMRAYDGQGHACPFRSAVQSIRDRVAAYCEREPKPTPSPDAEGGGR